MTSSYGLLARAAVLGAATGLRSTTGVAALVTQRDAGLGALLSHPAARPLAALAVAGEMVADKLPNAPSRLKPASLAFRVVLGGLAGAGCARSAGKSPAPSAVLPAAAVAAAAAAASTWLGYQARAALGRRLPAAGVAVAEDALAIGLAAVASR